METTKYFVAVVSKQHALRGVEYGFTQVCHGKKAPLMKMKKGDWLLIYSSKLEMGKNELCQSFTALGQIKDEMVYQVEMNSDFHPFRRNVDYYPCKEISIVPLIPVMDFIKNKKSWGFPFRFGFFEIGEKDFTLIKNYMLENEIAI